jgi:hypothetical protein
MFNEKQSAFLQAFCEIACISCKNGLANEVGLLAFKSGLNIVSKNLLASNFRYAIVELPIMIALGGWS